MNKIVSLSRLLKYSALAFALSLPLLEAGYWTTSGYPFLEPWFQASPLPVFTQWPVGWSDLTVGQKFLGFLSNLITLLFSMASLIYLSKLFGSMEQMRLFEKENALFVRKAGWALLWGQFLHPVSVACLSLSLTYRNPVGHRCVSVAIGTHELAMLALGLTLLLLSWILQEASAMNEEQKATV